MPNAYFQFKQFIVRQDQCAMKVTTDACLFGAWVAREASRKQPTVDSQKLLDIGAGTGLLSLMVAQKNNGSVDAIEVDALAATQAAENVAVSPWSERISVLHKDVLLWQPPVRYDCIFSNPPFYENELKSIKETKNIAHHDQGLKLAELLLFINNNLADEGYFFLLLPAKREKELTSLLANHRFFLQQKVLVQQTLKHQPFRLMIQGRRQKLENVAQEKISIKDENDAYSTAFISLLKNYYLYL